DSFKPRPKKAATKSARAPHTGEAGSADSRGKSRLLEVSRQRRMAQAGAADDTPVLEVDRYPASSSACDQDRDLRARLDGLFADFSGEEDASPADEPGAEVKKPQGDDESKRARKREKKEGAPEKKRRVRKKPPEDEEKARLSDRKTTKIDAGGGKAKSKKRRGESSSERRRRKSVPQAAAARPAAPLAGPYMPMGYPGYGYANYGTNAAYAASYWHAHQAHGASGWPQRPPAGS
ncbi:unnamed protein product, partial [Polarella glacialis]